MLRMLQWSACFALLSLTLLGCGKTETELSGPVTEDAMKVAKEEDTKAQDAERAEQQKALQVKQ